MNTARITHKRHGGAPTFTLSNGLVSRTILCNKTMTTLSINRRSQAGLDNDVELVRATSRECVLTINGQTYSVGGTAGQKDLAFLMDSEIDSLSPFSDDAIFLGARTEEYKHVISSPKSPAQKGISLVGTFEFSKGALRGLRVKVRHTIFDDLAVLEKQVEVINTTASPIRLNTIVFEELSTVETDSVVDPTTMWERQSITVLSDFMFHGMSISSANQIATWTTDDAFTTQVNYELKTPCKLRCSLPNGPDIDIAPGDTFVSPRSILVCHATVEREQRGKDIRTAWKGLAPWTGDNPLMLHLTSTNENTVRTAIDQCAECGFEMVIFSFGSGLNMEDISLPNINKFKAFADYAHAKGIRIGGYSLLASRSVSAEDDVINPETGRTGGTIFGNSPCLCSIWGLDYFKRIKTFLTATSFDLLEHDGSYPGDVCASTKHPGHRGKADSQWRQFELIRDLYMWCRNKGIYLNVPDTYFLCGSNKVGMGYRETNWSLPRSLQHIHSRQNMFDGTWEKRPSMGWMFVPLVQYHGGGADATIEPLREHLDDYKRHMDSCLGYGVQACYRGPRLYDSPETKAMVIRTVAKYKKYRRLLEGDITHLRRPDGRRIDAILHTDDENPARMMLVAFNPVSHKQSTILGLPSTLSPYKAIRIVDTDTGKSTTLTPEQNGRFEISVTVDGGSMRMLELVQ